MHGNTVFKRSDLLGRKCKYCLTRPEYLLYVDEVGRNTNMINDKNNGGERLACERRTVSRQHASTIDVYFTVLGFTNASGQSILCGIIIGGHKLTAYHVLGFDVIVGLPQEIITAVNRLNDEFFFENMSTRKKCPGDPPCSVNGKKISPFVTFSPYGGIISQILADMLKWIDDYMGLPRTEDGRTLCISLDGHLSRLEIPFLVYK